MPSPKVSVIIPNYNHARFLAERIGSVLRQTFEDFEVLVLDDASTDDSRAVIARFRDPRMRVICNQQNSGSTFRQWNRGLREARGQYVWFAESDDSADSQLLDELVAQLDKHPAAGLAHCGLMWLDDQGAARPAEWPDEARWQTDFVTRGSAECASHLLFGNTIPNASAVLFRRSVLERVGGADEAMKLCGDWMVYARVLASSDMAYVARRMNFFRQHDASVRTKFMATFRDVFERYAVAGFILQHCAVSAATRHAACEALADQWLACARNGSAAEDWNWLIYRSARRIDPALHHRLYMKLIRPWLARMKNRVRRTLTLRSTR